MGNRPIRNAPEPKPSPAPRLTLERVCWHCAHFGREVARFSEESRSIYCNRHRKVWTLAHKGCFYWQREPGADDDLGAAG